MKVRITPFERSIKILVDQRLTPKARTKRIAAFAQAEIDKADEINRQAFGGVSPPKTITVNGNVDAPLETANPDRGTIIAEWRLVGDVLSWIYQTLKQRSPVLSGRYRDSHALFVDGIETPVDDDAFKRPPAGSEFVFLNPLPYSRKIEIGKTRSGRDFVIQVPNRIYERTSADASSRFGNIARIRFGYQAAIGGGLVKRSGKDDRVPAITVSLR